MLEKLKFQFHYTIEHIRAGSVISVEETDNLVPTEGLDYVIGACLTAVSPITSWFVGLYEGNYTPTAGAVGSTISSVATECTAYTSATRLSWTPGGVSTGAVDNSASKAEFTFNATKTIYGGMLISSSVKGGSGTLMSLVRFPSPKAVETGDILRITAGITLVS